MQKQIQLPICLVTLLVLGACTPFVYRGGPPKFSLHWNDQSEESGVFENQERVLVLPMWTVQTGIGDPMDPLSPRLLVGPPIVSNGLSYRDAVAEVRRGPFGIGMWIVLGPHFGTNIGRTVLFHDFVAIGESGVVTSKGGQRGNVGPMWLSELHQLLVGRKSLETFLDRYSGVDGDYRRRPDGVKAYKGRSHREEIVGFLNSIPTEGQNRDQWIE